jgi:uncharacterized membrane protein YhaH (DUF805 family)
MTSIRLLSAHGRVPRGQFWLQAIAFWAVFYTVSAVLGALATGIVVGLVNGVALVTLVMLCIRRLHDRNYAGWWLLAVIVPVVGALWLLWQLALRRGIAQDNRWGPDPLQPRGDYLVVA